MKSSIHIPIFTSGHPLVLSTCLKSKGYKPLVYTLKRDVIKVTRTKMVFILVSVYDIVFLKEALINARFSKVRIIAFASWQELKKHPANMFLGERFSKKDINSFTPEFVNVETLKGPDVTCLIQGQDFVKAFTSSTQRLRKSLTL